MRAGKAAAGARAQAEQAQAAEVQMRLPGEDWKERHGAAGVQAEKRRNSPIVELSLLLVLPPLQRPCSMPHAREGAAARLPGQPAFTQPAGARAARPLLGPRSAGRLRRRSASSMACAP